jgi:hypothetical protein
VPISRYRTETLRQLGWQPCKTQTVVEWRVTSKCRSSAEGCSLRPEPVPQPGNELLTLPDPLDSRLPALYLGARAPGETWGSGDVREEGFVPPMDAGPPGGHSRPP